MDFILIESPHLPFIFGFNWLSKHNPQIDWNERKFYFYDDVIVLETAKADSKPMIIYTISCNEISDEPEEEEERFLVYTTLINEGKEDEEEVYLDDKKSEVPECYKEFAAVFNEKREQYHPPHRKSDVKIKT